MYGRRYWASLVLFLFSFASASAEILNYDSVRIGKLSGKLMIEWIEPDLFIFTPDSKAPLSFMRGNGTAITPRRIMTDGGSIPRPIWVLRNYSPWGFAPAFIVHDWLFTMKQCKFAGFETLTLEESGLIMAEIMKTMIEQGKIEAGKYTVISMHEAVTSRFARTSWDEGICTPVPPGMTSVQPIAEYKLDFDN